MLTAQHVWVRLIVDGEGQDGGMELAHDKPSIGTRNGTCFVDATTHIAYKKEGTYGIEWGSESTQPNNGNSKDKKEINAHTTVMSYTFGGDNVTYETSRPMHEGSASTQIYSTRKMGLKLRVPRAKPTDKTRGSIVLRLFRPLPDGNYESVPFVEFRFIFLKVKREIEEVSLEQNSLKRTRNIDVDALDDKKPKRKRTKTAATTAQLPSPTSTHSRSTRSTRSTRASMALPGSSARASPNRHAPPSPISPIPDISSEPRQPSSSSSSSPVLPDTTNADLDVMAMLDATERSSLKAKEKLAKIKEVQLLLLEEENRETQLLDKIWKALDTRLKVSQEKNKRIEAFLADLRS